MKIYSARHSEYLLIYLSGNDFICPTYFVINNGMLSIYFASALCHIKNAASKHVKKETWSYSTRWQMFWGNFIFEMEFPIPKWKVLSFLKGQRHREPFIHTDCASAVICRVKLSKYIELIFFWQAWNNCRWYACGYVNLQNTS